MDPPEDEKTYPDERRAQKQDDDAYCDSVHLGMFASSSAPVRYDFAAGVEEFQNEGGLFGPFLEIIKG